MPRIVCPACGASHQVSVLQRGYLRLPCRGCGRELELHGAADSSPHHHSAEATMTTAGGGVPCPHCGELIRLDASKCRHCRRFVAVAPASQVSRAKIVVIALLSLALAALLVWLGRARVIAGGL